MAPVLSPIEQPGSSKPWPCSDLLTVSNLCISRPAVRVTSRQQKMVGPGHLAPGSSTLTHCRPEAQLGGASPSQGLLHFPCPGPSFLRMESYHLTMRGVFLGQPHNSLDRDVIIMAFRQRKGPPRRQQYW